MSNTRSSKRRKASPDGNVSPHVMVTDLPDTVLVDVAKFLPKPSRALFAVALAAPSPSWVQMSHQRKPSPSSLSRAILAATSSPCDHSLEGMIRYSDDPWAVLDFELVDKSLASKLADDDVAAILFCINAVDKLERLKLTGLVNITGRGLDPLRGSTVLQQVDLSLQKLNGSPKSFKSLIREDIVVSILDSIVDKSGNSLKHLSFPKEWTRYHIGERRPSLFDFLNKYKQLLQNRSFNCGACGQSDNCRGAGGDDWVEAFGVQFFTCCLCMKNFCDNSAKLYGCVECDKRYCVDCASDEVCDKCSDSYCRGCSAFKRCEDCQSQCCSACYNICDSCSKRKCCDSCTGSENANTTNSSDNAMLACNGDLCKKANCSGCTDSKNVRACSECDMQYCFNCLLEEYQGALDVDEQFCSKCAARVVSGALVRK